MRESTERSRSFLDEHGITHLHAYGIDRMHMACGYLSWKQSEKKHGLADARGNHPTCLRCVIARDHAFQGL